jgi:hypothetical protein
MAGEGDATGEPTFREDGACIKESRDPLAALGVGVSAAVGAGLDFSGVVSARGEGVADRSGETPARAFFLGFAETGPGFSSNLPRTIVPETRLVTL